MKHFEVVSKNKIAMVLKGLCYLLQPSLKTLHLVPSRWIWNITNKSIWTKVKTTMNILLGSWFVWIVPLNVQMCWNQETLKQCTVDDKRCQSFINVWVLHKTGWWHWRLTFEFFNIKPNSWHYVGVLKHDIENWFSSDFSCEPDFLPA